MAAPGSWFRRYLWRRDLVHKLRARGAVLRRRLVQDEHQDLRRLHGHHQPATVLDVGAHRGDETDEFLASFPEAMIHAFEPSPSAYERLEARFGDHPRVRCHRVAVTDAVGTAVLRIDDQTFAGGSNSLLTHSGRFHADQGAADFSPVEVATTTLDQHCAEFGIDHVEILKVDVEGAERLVLDGASTLLGSAAVDVVDLEVRVLADFEGQPLFGDLLGLLADQGYRLFNLYAPAESPLGQLLWANALFVSSSFRAELTRIHGAHHTRF